MAVNVEQTAVSALLDWLRWKLPAKVTEVNLTRAAVLKATTPGPYTIPNPGAGITPAIALSMQSRSGNYTSILLTHGSRSATQVAADFNNAGLGSIASVDTSDRLVITSTTAPSGTYTSLISVGPDVNEGVNAAFGWSAGGEHVVSSPLTSPGHRGVCDGWPQMPDMGQGAAFAIVIGERSSVPLAPDVRRDEYLVTLDLSLLYPPRHQETHRNREPVTAVVRCVRQLITSTEGRQLGRASNGDIMFVREKGCKIAGRPWRVTHPEAKVNPIYDVANLQLEVRVFERQ